MSAKGGRTVEAPGFWKSYVAFPFIRCVAMVLVTVLGPLRVRGWFRVPRRGGLLIIANHQSYFDPVALYVACRRHVVFVARQEVWQRPTIAKFMTYFNAMQIRTGEGDREAIRSMVDHIKAGRAVCLFPEGRLSEDGQLLPLQPGFALVAKLANCPVIVCALEGTNKVIPSNTEKPRMAKSWVTVHWGKLFPQGAWAHGDEAIVQTQSELLSLLKQDSQASK